ncbi:hypothetical protein [Novipirellula galeiformis]|uniref:hypothetical protein n=1 Tax=Novipirellula galeiformis TaxID=2528004 RepID=UPI0011B82164|nr:hypothetical protein [Novipirellula galeiformis]
MRIAVGKPFRWPTQPISSKPRNVHPQFTIRGAFAAIAFTAAFFALAVPNYSAWQSTWYTTIITTARNFAFSWSVVVVSTLILMPVFIRVRVHVAAWLFFAIACIAMLSNYLLPLGQL